MTPRSGSSINRPFVGSDGTARSPQTPNREEEERGGVLPGIWCLRRVNVNDPSKRDPDFETDPFRIVQSPSLSVSLGKSTVTSGSCRRCFRLRGLGSKVL